MTEYFGGTDVEPGTPTCDICGQAEGNSPNMARSNGEQFEADWNGETGNHVTCETDPLGVGETLVDRHGNEYYGDVHRVGTPEWHKAEAEWAASEAARNANDMWADYIIPDTAMEDLGND